MEAVAEYILSIVCGAILCGIVTKIPFQDGTAKKLLVIITGIFMVFTLIKPLAAVELKDPATWLTEFNLDAQSAVEEGEAQTNIALQQSIKAALETYILDKAAAMGASIEVELILSGDGLPVPSAAVLNGDVSPYHKMQLQYILENELGIIGENQLWK